MNCEWLAASGFVFFPGLPKSYSSLGQLTWASPKYQIQNLSVWA